MRSLSSDFLNDSGVFVVHVPLLYYNSVKMGYLCSNSVLPVLIIKLDIHIHKIHIVETQMP